MEERFIIPSLHGEDREYQVPVRLSFLNSKTAEWIPFQLNMHILPFQARTF